MLAPREASGSAAGAPPAGASGVRIPAGGEVTGKPPPESADDDGSIADDRKNAAS
jgi:hypothetical protein